MSQIDDAQKRRQLDQLLTGPLTNQPSSTRTVIDPEAGIRPPAWWDGDEDASQTSLAVRRFG